MSDLENKTEKEFDVSSNSALRDFYHRYIAALNERDFAVVASLIHDDVTVNGQPTKRQDVLAGLKWLTDVVPNYVWKIEDLFIDGERIAVRLSDTGKPEKTFLGSEPTGASIKFTEFASYRVRDGRFAEMWYLLDTASITEQLKK